MSLGGVKKWEKEKEPAPYILFGHGTGSFQAFTCFHRNDTLGQWLRQALPRHLCRTFLRYGHQCLCRNYCCC